MSRCAGGIKRDWIKLRLVDRCGHQGMLLIDVLTIHLQEWNQIALSGSVVRKNCIRSGSRIDRATISADIDERVRSRLATCSLL